MYFVCSNLIIDLVSKNTEEIYVNRHIIRLKLPQNIKNTIKGMSNLKKKLLITLARMFIYVFISIVATQTIKLLFEFKNNLPNFFTIFSTIWGITTFLFENLVSKFNKEHK